MDCNRVSLFLDSYKKIPLQSLNFFFFLISHFTLYFVEIRFHDLLFIWSSKY
jgi:hypothetical protein